MTSKEENLEKHSESSKLDGDLSLHLEDDADSFSLFKVAICDIYLNIKFIYSYSLQLKLYKQ
jgi:hypothetical protein